MIHYINVNSKRFCGRNNNINTKPLILEYNTVEHLEFQFITDNNQVVELTNLSGLALAVGLKQNKPSYDLLALSRDYTIEDNVLKFNLNCYTTNWLREVNKNNTEAYIEISQESISAKQVLLRDYAYVWPRTLIDGLSPEEIQSNNYFTKSETNEAIENAIEGIGISGYVTTEEFEEGLATKQDTITDENKLDFTLLSGVPNYVSGLTLNGTPVEVVDGVVGIPRTSQSDWGVVKVNPGVGIGADSGQIFTIRAESADIAARTQNFKPIVPSNLNEAVKATLTDANHITLTNEEKTTAQTVLGVDEAISGFATEQYVDNAVSGKQDEITVDNKLDYALISGAPEIPSDYLSGVSANGTALTVTDKTVNIPKASTSDWGLVKTRASAGIMVDSETDFIYTVQAVDSEISSRQNTHYVITPNNLNNAVKAALTDANHLTLTDAEKTTAQTVLGVDGVISGFATETYVDNAVSGLASESYVNDAVSGKQDIIDSSNPIYGDSVRMDINHWQGDPDFDVESAVNMTRDDVYAVSGVVSGLVSGKQDAITNDNKLDYGLLSGTPTIPLSTSQLTNDSDFATSGYVDGAVSGKLDISGYVVPYRLPYVAGANAWLEEDIGVDITPWSDNTIIANDIKVITVAYANNGEDHLIFPLLFGTANENVIKTVEVWVKMAGNITEAQGIQAIVTPSSCFIVDADNFPTKLKGEATNSEAYTYHIFVMRTVPRLGPTYYELCYSHAFNTNLDI